MQRPSTIILSNNRPRSHRQRAHRYHLPTHSQSASPQSTASSHQRINVTPPPPSESDISYYRRSRLLQTTSPPLLLPNDEQQNEQNEDDQNEDGNEMDLIFASRSSSPFSSHLTHSSMTKSDDASNENIAAEALVKLKNSTETNGNFNKMEMDENVNENGIDWENISDSSEDDSNYLSLTDDDLSKWKKSKLKISSKMNESFTIPNGYLSHSVFVCPIQTDYCSDPQTKLACGHLISFSAFERLKHIQRQRQHQNERQRTLKIRCPNCDFETDTERDVRYVYLGRFPNLRTDRRFNRILDNKELHQNAAKWIPGTSQINGQE